MFQLTVIFEECMFPIMFHALVFPIKQLAGGNWRHAQNGENERLHFEFLNNLK